MTWTDASLITVAMFAAIALLLLIGYSLLTLVISLVKYLETPEYDIYWPDDYRPWPEQKDGDQ